MNEDNLSYHHAVLRAGKPEQEFRYFLYPIIPSFASRTAYRIVLLLCQVHIGGWVSVILLRVGAAWSRQALFCSVLPLQCLPVPMRQICPGFIGAVEKVQQCLFR
jgi:hypothetical protein